MLHKIIVHSYYEMNSYIIHDDKECFIIDPGFKSIETEEYIKDNNLTLKGIILTHGHLDHIGGVHNYNTLVYLHEEEISLFLDDRLNGFGNHNIKPSFDKNKIKLIGVNNQSKLLLGKDEITFIHTPGHTKGSMCIKYKNKVVTGDTLFKDTIGITNYPTGDIMKMRKSIVNLIEQLPDNTNVYPGHGPKTTIKYERKNNRWYLKWKK